MPKFKIVYFEKKEEIINSDDSLLNVHIAANRYIKEVNEKEDTKAGCYLLSIEEIFEEREQQTS